MKGSKWLRTLIAAIAIASSAPVVAGGAMVNDGTSNTRQQAGVSTSPGRTLARKAGGHVVEYLAIPGVRGTGGGAT